MAGDFNSDFNFDFFKEVYEGTGSAVIKPVASGVGEIEEVVQPPVAQRPGGGFVFKLPLPLPRRRRKPQLVVGEGAAILSLFAEGRGEAEEAPQQPQPAEWSPPIPIVEGVGAAVLMKADAFARGEHIDVQGWNEDFLIMLDAA